MLNHGISTGALFLLVGMLYERRHTRQHRRVRRPQGASCPGSPRSSCWSAFSSIAVPGFNGFVGEFLILLGSWARRTLTGDWSVPLASWPRPASCWPPAYMLWMVQRVLLRRGHRPAERRTLPDLSAREACVLAPLVALAIFMGVASPLFTRTDRAGGGRAGAERARRSCRRRRRWWRSTRGGAGDGAMSRDPRPAAGHPGADRGRDRARWCCWPRPSRRAGPGRARRWFSLVGLLARRWRASSLLVRRGGGDLGGTLRRWTRSRCSCTA